MCCLSKAPLRLLTIKQTNIQATTKRFPEFMSGPLYNNYDIDQSLNSFIRLDLPQFPIVEVSAP
jgi:hypothetical protein